MNRRRPQGQDGNHGLAPAGGDILSEAVGLARRDAGRFLPGTRGAFAALLTHALGDRHAPGDAMGKAFAFRIGDNPGRAVAVTCRNAISYAEGMALLAAMCLALALPFRPGLRSTGRRIAAAVVARADGAA